MRLSALLIACLLTLLLTACSESEHPLHSASKAKGSHNIGFKLEIPNSTDFQTLFSRAEVLVFAGVDSPDTIRTAPMIYDGTILTANVDSVPAGTNRKFVINVFDSSDILFYSGETVANVGEYNWEEIPIEIFPATEGNLSIVGIVMDRIDFIDLTNGLIAYYPFDESADDFGSNNHNALANNIEIVPGKHGNAFQFTSDSMSYVEVPGHSDLNISDNITITGWFKTSSASLGGTVVDSGGNLETHGGYTLNLAYNSVNFTVSRPVEYVHMSSYMSDEWHFFSAQYETSGSYEYLPVRSMVLTVDEMTYTGYLSGEEQAGLDKWNNSAPLLIGAAQGLMAGERECYLDGALDEIRIYNRSLSVEEIRALRLQE